MAARRARTAGKRPAPQCEILDRGQPRLPRAWLRSVVAAALAHGGRPDLPVSLLLTDDAGIARLHQQFLGDRRATDVIAFDLGDGADVVVSKQTAARVARQRGHGLEAEIALYVVHGLLHVCGHDDHRKRDRARMRAAERVVLAQLGLEVAPVDE